MRSWLLGRSLLGAWLRLFILALLPLIITASVVAVYQAKRIRRDVEEAGLAWQPVHQLIVDQALYAHRDLARRIASKNEGRPQAEVVATLNTESKGRPLVLGMAWIPAVGEPVVTEQLQPIWSEVQAKLATSAESFQLFTTPRLHESLILVSERRATGQHVTVLLLREIAKQLSPVGDTGRLFTLEDPSGAELAMHDPSVHLAETADTVRIETSVVFAPGWHFVGYVSTRQATERSQVLLWQGIFLTLAALLAGLGLAFPAALNLLEPLKRLRQVARTLPASAQVAFGDMTQSESAVALVDQLQDRLLLLEEEHMHFFGESDVPFCIVAWPGIVLEVNQALCRLIGYPPEYFRDHRLSDTLHPTEQFRVDEAHPELQVKHMTVHWTWHHLSASGEDLWINWSTTSDVERRFLYVVGRDVTAERQQERNRLLQSTVQELWLTAKSGEGVQPLLDELVASMASLFPGAEIGVWEETANGRWLLRAGGNRIQPETAPLSFEITGELVRFGMLAVESTTVLTADEVSFFESTAEMIGTAVKLEREGVRLMIQHGVNQLLAEAEGIADMLVRLLPLIARPMLGVAARFWAPDGGDRLRLEADWAEPGHEASLVAFDLHKWMVYQTLADGHPRWIAEGTRLPNRPDELMPVGRITFAVRVGAEVVGCVDCLIPVLRTPEAGFLTLMDSLGAQIGLYQDRRMAEEGRRQQALLASGRGDVMDLVASGAPLESVLDRICRLAESLLPNVWTLGVFYDAEPDRALILVGPSCPPDRMAQFHAIVQAPGSHERMRRWKGPNYLSNSAEMLATMPFFGPPLIEMGVLNSWVCPISIPPSDGTLLYGFYSAVPGALSEQTEPVLLEVSRLARMAVERWWLEEALNRRVDLLLEHMQEGLIAVDGELQVVQINPAARKILHLTAGARQSLPEPLAEAFRQALLADAQPFPATMKVEGAPVYAYVSPVRSEEGALLGAIAILEDSALRQRFQQLQTALVANVSHDLKAPLAALGALVETVADQQLPPELQQQYLGSMRDEIARLRRLTQDLLLLARLDAGLLTQEPEVLAMDDLLRGLAEVWAPRCQAHGLALAVTGGPALAWADYDRVTQILINLLDNAIKFTPPGGVIELGVEPAGDSGRMRFFVRDTGLGIAPEHMERLGSRFYMVDPARQRTNPNGTGLGISIVRSLAELMGGEVTIESAPGSGTTVWVSLPVPTPSV